jgi:hypothetical protein
LTVSNQREWRLQSIADRFIDKAVLPPFFTTAIDIASDSMGNLGRVAKLKARGAVFGLPDAIVAQGDGIGLSTVAWIEYKRGTGLTARQEATHLAMRRVGFQVFTCSTIMDVLDALRLAGFLLHEDAATFARQFEDMLTAADAKASAKSPRKRSATASRPAKATPYKLQKLRSMGIPV